MERRTLLQLDGIETRIDGEGDERLIVGHAAVFWDGTPETEFELWPGVSERIMPGAFDSAIRGRGESGQVDGRRRGDDVRALFNHNTDLILGRRFADTLEIGTDRRGLFYRILPAETVAARDVVAFVERGDITGSSFAFQVLKQQFIENDDGTEVREIRDVRLFDVGPVTFPAYEGTTAGLRSSDGIDEARAAYAAYRQGKADRRETTLRKMDRDLAFLRLIG